MWRNKLTPFSHRTVKFFATKQKTRLENAGLLSSQLSYRTVIRFAGPDSMKFRQGMLTNDVSRFVEPIDSKVTTLATSNLPTGGTKPVYAALLTAQGWFLYDFFCIGRPGLMRSLTGPRRVLDRDLNMWRCWRMLMGRLLMRYRLRSKVDIEHVGKDFCFWQRYGGDLSDKSSVEEPESAGVGWVGNVDCSAMSSSQGSEGVAMVQRSQAQFSRLQRNISFWNSTLSAPLVEADKETSEENYLLWRSEQGIAKGPNEIPKR